MNEENHMGWKLVRGVRRDITDLFKLFAKTNSVRYEDFSKTWRELKFSLIFNNRTRVIEILEFTEEIFQITKEYLSSVYEFHTRVAALYTLYGLYFKQPMSGATKIRFTKTEWQDLKSLIEDSKSANHYDVIFIFTKLYLNGAFSFTATKRPAGLERAYRKYSEKRNMHFSKSLDEDLLYRPLVSDGLVKSLMKLESLYCRKKSELLGKKNLVFIDGTFGKTLQKDLDKYATGFEFKQVKAHNAVVGVDRSDAEMSEPENGSNTADVTKVRSEKTSESKSLKASSNTSEDNTSEELLGKKKKFGKRLLQVLAKKKAEYYIQKLQSNNSNICKSEVVGLGELLNDDSETE